VDCRVASLLAETTRRCCRAALAETMRGLLIGNNPQATQHPRIMKANEKFLPWSELQPMITTLRIAAVNGDVMMIRSMLQLLVPEYQPDEKVVDWVYREQVAQAGKLER